MFFKEVMKIKITENEIRLKICEALFYQEISCASVIAEKIDKDCNSTKISNQLRELKGFGITESTGKVTINYLVEHRNGNFGKFYLLTEIAREAMKEIMEEQKNKKLTQ